MPSVEQVAGIIVLNTPLHIIDGSEIFMDTPTNLQMHHQPEVVINIITLQSF